MQDSKKDTKKDSKPNRLIINIFKGCASVESTIPPGVELVIKDYDVLDEKEGLKRDKYGAYEETIWTPEDNEALSRGLLK